MYVQSAILESGHEYSLRDTVLGHGWVWLDPFVWDEAVQTLYHTVECATGVACRWRVRQEGTRRIRSWDWDQEDQEWSWRRL